MDNEYESWIWDQWQKIGDSSDNDPDRDNERRMYYRYHSVDPKEIAAFNALLGDIVVDL